MISRLNEHLAEASFVGRHRATQSRGYFDGWTWWNRSGQGHPSGTRCRS